VRSGTGSEVKDSSERALGLPIAEFGTEANQVFRPTCSNYHLWLKRIKTVLDPGNACDPFFYVEGVQVDSEEKALFFNGIYFSTPEVSLCLNHQQVRLCS
jgi:hypothetical protein